MKIYSSAELAKASPSPSLYSSEFFRKQIKGSLKSAKAVVPLVLSAINVHSVIDVGCGVGTWASEFLTNGIVDITGIDGAYVDPSTLLIPHDRFHARDLSQPIELNRTFDLAVCLEVAEHLPVSRAAELVYDLTRLAPCILFSAAIPGQGGTNHINEQQLSFWRCLFSQRGYTSIDLLRHAVWENSDVEWWYRQNVVVFAKEDHPIIQRGLPEALDLVHPALFTLCCTELHSIRDRPTLGHLFCALPGALRRSILARTQRLFRRYMAI